MTIISVTAAMTIGRPPAPSVSTTSLDTSDTKIIHLTVTGLAGDIVDVELSDSIGFGTILHSTSVTVTAGILSSGHDWTTAVLDDGTYYIRARQRRLHPSTIPVYSAYSSVLTALVQAAEANPAPVVADVTIGLGRLTRSGVTFYGIISTGGTITGEGGTNSLAGTNNDHFTINASGEMTTTAAFLASPQNSYTLTATVYNAAGSDTATLTINTEALTYDVNTIASLQTAVQHAKANNPTSNSKVYIRNGITLGDFSTGLSFTGSTNYVFPGTLSQANSALSDFTGYDRNATASLTGGSCEISCRVAYGAKIAGAMSFTGASGFIISDLTICRRMDTEPVRVNNQPALKGTSYTSLTFAANSTHTTRGHFIVRNCRIGSLWADNPNVRLSIVGVTIGATNSVSIEDCAFNGVMNGVNVGGADRFYFVRNSLKQVILDGLPCRNINTATIDPVIRHISDVTYYDRCEDALFVGGHNDFIQLGTWADRVDTFFLSGWNYLVRASQGHYVDDCAGPWTLGNTYPASNSAINGGRFYTRTSDNSTAAQAAAGTADAEPGVGASWQTYWVDQAAVSKTQVEVRGICYKNFSMAVATANMAAHRGVITYDRCTIISDPFSLSAGHEARFLAYRDPDGIVSNSIGGRIVNLYTGVFTPTNYQPVVKGTEGDYFVGPFTEQGGSAPAPTLDLTSVTTVRSSVDAAYTPKSGYTSMGHLAA